MSSERDRWKRVMVGIYYRAWEGDEPAVAKFDANYRDYFLEILRRRLHRRLRTLFDLEDLLQEFYGQIFATPNPRLLTNPQAQPVLLMRICERTALAHNRRYLETAKRDLRRETHQDPLPETWRAPAQRRLNRRRTS
jgi:hypothetical protein